LTFVTVVGSLPLGILLALARRSELPVVRWGAIGFIEIYDLDLAAMGGNVRPQGIECLLDPVQDSYF